MNKIDRDRIRNRKGSTNFDISAWAKKQLENRAKLSEWFLGQVSQIDVESLNDWEASFVAGLYDQIINKGRPPTSKQAVYFDLLMKKI